MRTFTYAIGADYAGKMVEAYLRHEAGLSSRLLVRLKHDPMGMLLNGSHTRTIDLLSEGDILTVTIRDRETEVSFCEIPVPILYEDEDVIVYNKPPFMACHQAKRYQDATLANVFAAHCVKRGIHASFRAVNRLDRDTSGAVVAAKNAFAAAGLTRKVDKGYFGIVTGRLPERGGVIAPIARPNPRYTIREVAEGGQWARTDFQAVGELEGYTAVRYRLHTGRTHQIRVHMAWLGHPLAGDDMYGGSRDLLSRQALHCEWVAFRHPVSGKFLRLEAPFPTDMEQVLAPLRLSRPMETY